MFTSSNFWETKNFRIERSPIAMIKFSLSRKQNYIEMYKYIKN